ncbi:hypothetical protein PGTUg99_036075, partial [Puccinia graminis f. sp. tritici]
IYFCIVLIHQLAHCQTLSSVKTIQFVKHTGVRDTGYVNLLKDQYTTGASQRQPARYLDGQTSLRQTSQTFLSADIKLAALKPGGWRGRGVDPCPPGGMWVAQQ